MFLIYGSDNEPLLADMPEGCTAVDIRTESVPDGIPYPPCPVGSLPVVLVLAPAYARSAPVIGADGTFEGMTTVNEPEQYDAIRRPASWAAVEQYQAYVAQRAVDQPVE